MNEADVVRIQFFSLSGLPWPAHASMKCNVMWQQKQEVGVVVEESVLN